MKFSRFPILIFAISVFFVGGYLATSLMAPGVPRTQIRDLLGCVVPLFANACLLWNAASPRREQNAFWNLLALSCTLLLAGRLIDTYGVFALNHVGLSLFPANVFPFLHVIPLMAAIGLAPHRSDKQFNLSYGLLDLLLLAGFWIYLYVFSVLPWELVEPNAALFHRWNVTAFAFQTVIVVVGFGFLLANTKGDWRIVYGNVAGATALYSLGTVIMFNLNWTNAATLRGACYVMSMIWLALTGVTARNLSLAPESHVEPARDVQWQGGLSMLTILSLPLFGVWAVFGSSASAAVRAFRLEATFVAILVCSGLAFFRQHLAHIERTRLVQQLSTSLENVKRLQTQFVQSEKLAALGELAAGAAHEINNPLTAILGYADLLLAENPLASRPHTLGQKINEQARRTTALVTNLLSFARRVPAEKQLLDLNTVLESAVRLRKIDAHTRNIRIELEGRNSVLPAVRGDPNQLLQVFHHLLGNAVDAMEETGGVLLIRALAEKGSVVIEFSDTGPGMKEPERVFDPFYTTKPVGKATGLGLSICYGIMQEHGGTIAGFNRPEGGCTFRLELPAALSSLPRASLTPISQRTT
ncbi:MAG TPA: HAMP domain-containing sensor histidine kinase [Candidatus Acidoferrales bacterium]|jgi:signal transduction histidine kinase|nr:HAMP domain-containing sensor histidine kinase [Candidatus Acidoferrales bacterium]